MPKAWSVLLENSTLSEEQKDQNPEAVVAALEFYSKQQTTSDDGRFSKFAENRSSLYPEATRQSALMVEKSGAPDVKVNEYLTMTIFGHAICNIWVGKGGSPG
eukprot:Pgem_evm1s8599